MYIYIYITNVTLYRKRVQFRIFTNKMFIQTHAWGLSTIYPIHRFRRNPASGTPASARKPFNVFQLNGVSNTSLRNMKNQGAKFSVSEGPNSSIGMERKRKVVEHICLLKAREDLSDEEEKDMLDYLYTSQYQMGGIVAISLGRISGRNTENYTHAVYMRFQRKEDLAKFYENPFYLGVLRDHVMPYCHGLIYVDYESEVEDDILPIFRKGEEFNYGVECILLIAFVESALGAPAEDALASLTKLMMDFPSLIVQATKGLNFNLSNTEYTYGVVIRFRSFEAFEIFMNSSEYKDMWVSKFQQITEKMLSIHFSVDPVGTEIM
ncbi:stress-response A/B barrel domain-containing protein UP3 isoform X2 [Cornus florida]|uniref:stress-response A/B barrel domain-containing protein UP3 isoform X2 n=1 Tax=Cornus florida TaxID=4283 RepID=UPI00289C1202|nr:stress-response A/B barrel domain-containing protein UP3 isoform X2 [Cornus florida]